MLVVLDAVFAVAVCSDAGYASGWWCPVGVPVLTLATVFRDSAARSWT
ncbi:hypothetical protein AF72_02860 [Xylella taiwanensis]|uniref:Uncharacterized protein n=1 Tax=Xylella taiwanensis TaxID=1444770 RepID=Z9JL38_9GAMM|nr:hypothetical protein AF72_02860 [Xylella taiwanensis]